jgi:hypothetical protein
MPKFCLFLFAGMLTCLNCFSQNTYPFPQNGNVGIGMTNPQGPLNVKGSSFWGTLKISPSTENAETGIGFSPHTSETDYSNMWFLGVGGWSTGQSFVIGTSVVGSPSLALLTNGNVGIGTTDPKGYKLAVAGSAIAESMTVKLQGSWPDYVFKPAYQLPSLLELKSYIDQNGHLPGIPSEQQVAKDGVNLGEMNKLLLKKVEELTLYLIEQEKRIDQLTNAINGTVHK